MLIWVQFQQLCLQRFWPYGPKMTSRMKSRVDICPGFTMSLPLWWYHGSVATILLESSVFSSHLCFNDSSNYLHATFVKLIKSKDLPSLHSAPATLPLILCSFLPCSYQSFLEGGEHYYSEPLFLSEDIDSNVISFYSSLKNSHSSPSLSLFILVRLIFFFLEWWTCTILYLILCHLFFTFETNTKENLFSGIAVALV